MLRREPLLRALAVPPGVEAVGTPADAFLLCARPDPVIERGAAVARAGGRTAFTTKYCHVRHHLCSELNRC